MYESPGQRAGRPSVVGARVRQIPVEAHEGSHRDFLRRHEAECQESAHGSSETRQQLAGRLYDRVHDLRILRCACDDIVAAGPKAAGPNGVRLERLSKYERLEALKSLSRAIRDGNYARGPMRRRNVPKTSGNGTRPIDIPNAEDKLGQKSLILVLQPFLDPTFDKRSLGFRPRRSREEALTLAKHLATQEGLWTWITADLRNAFTRVVKGRVWEILRNYHHLPPKLIELIQLAVGQELRGVPQGGPLSALLLNVLLDRMLDQAWRKRHPDMPMIRVADDILILANSRERAQTVYPELASLAISAGMELKGSLEQDARDLEVGQVAQWLGLDVTLADGELRTGIGTAGLTKLQSEVAKCHLEPIPPLAATNCVRGWIGQQGCCYDRHTAPEIVGQVISRAAEQGFEELPSAEEILEAWKAAHARYRCLVRVLMAPVSLGIPDGSARQHQFSAVLGREAGALTESAPASSFSAGAPRYRIHTDGSCLENPGIGGWAYRRHRLDTESVHYESASALRATNNRMELTAAIKGLADLNSPSVVEVLTDSRYVYDGITAHIGNWSRNGWRKVGGGQIRNASLWKQLAEQCQRHLVRWRWIAGHSGHEGNEAVDRLAREAAERRAQIS